MARKLAQRRIVERTRLEAFNRWLRALRNGHYKQAEGTLRESKWLTDVDKQEHSFCCLGVLCDLARKDGGEQWSGSYFMDESGRLPAKVRKFMGITPKQQDNLIVLNDNERYSFRKIADYIEIEVMPKALSR